MSALFQEYLNMPYLAAAQSELSGLYFFLGAYFGVLGGVALLAYRKKQAAELQKVTSADEIRAHYSGTYHPALIALTIFSSAFSGYTVIGVPQTTYDSGFLVLMFFAGAGAQGIGMLMILPRLRRIIVERGYLSPTDFVADRYRNKLLTFLYVVASCLPQFIYLAVQLASFGETLNAITRGWITKLVGVVICIVFMLTMELLGGMHSVVLSDVVQAIIMLGGFVILTCVMVFEDDVFSLGGDGECKYHQVLNNATSIRDCRSKNATEPNFLTDQVSFGCLYSVAPELTTPLSEVPTVGPLLVAGYFWFVANFFIFCLNPHLVQRLGLAERDSGLKTATMLLIFSPFVAMIPGVLAGLLVISKSPVWTSATGCTASTFGTLGIFLGQRSTFHFALITLLSTAALAAIMSSADSVILGVAQSFCISIYKQIMSPDASISSVVTVGKVVSLVMAIVCGWIAMNITASSFSNWLAIQNGILFQVAPAMMLGLYKEYNGKAILAGIIAGFLVLFPAMYVQFYFPITSPLKLFFLLFQAPNFAAMVNFLVAYLASCCLPADEGPAEESDEYQNRLSSTFGDRLTLYKIEVLINGHILPNPLYLKAAFVLLFFTLPVYKSDAIIGIFPGWVWLVLLFTVLTTILVFLAARSWTPLEPIAPPARKITAEMSFLSQGLHVDQVQPIF